jgi:hypothetical protein
MNWFAPQETHAVFAPMVIEMPALVLARERTLMNLTVKRIV